MSKEHTLFSIKKLPAPVWPSMGQRLSASPAKFNVKIAQRAIEKERKDPTHLDALG